VAGLGRAPVSKAQGEEKAVPAVWRTDGLAGIAAPKQGQPAVLFPVSGIFQGTPPKKKKEPASSCFNS